MPSQLPQSQSQAQPQQSQEGQLELEGEPPALDLDEFLELLHCASKHWDEVLENHINPQVSRNDGVSSPSPSPVSPGFGELVQTLLLRFSTSPVHRFSEFSGTW